MKKMLYGVMAATMLGGAAWADSSAMDTNRTNTATDSTAKAAGSNIGSDSRIDAEGQMGTRVSKPASNLDAQNLKDIQANNSVEGTVSKVKHDKIMLDGQKDAFYLNDSSTIMRDGQVASRSDLKKGADVRVSFDLKDGKKWASTVTLEPAADTHKTGSFDTKTSLPSDSDTKAPIPSDSINNPSKY